MGYTRWGRFHSSASGSRSRRLPARLLGGIAGLLSLTVIAKADGPAGQTRDCASCHRFEAALSHPVDLRPSMAIPASLPLENGRITCQTCHDAGPGHSAGSGGVALRVTGLAGGICMACHQRSTDPESAHATGMSMRAHLRSTKARDDGLLDPESQSCIACHDGTAAADTGVGSRGHDRIEAEQSHPIGVRYTAQRSSRRGDGALVPANALDPRLRLFGQAVGCGTCHSLYSRQDKHLVMSNLKSRLCLSCHVE